MASNFSRVCKLTSQLQSCATRSEEHTSELQSHVNLVCRLLLEKKINKCRNFFIASDRVYISPSISIQPVYPPPASSHSQATSCLFFKNSAPSEFFPFSLPGPFCP